MATPRAAPRLAFRTLVGTMLGKLIAGDATWWENRPVARAALTDLLKLEWEQLREPEGEAMPFAEFPELDPIAVGQEHCALRDGTWVGPWAAQLGARVLRTGQQHSILAVVGPGWGKSLALWWWRSRGGVAHACETLSDAAAADLPREEVVLVEIERADPPRDPKALDKLKSHAGLVLLPPISYGPLPSGWSRETWEPAPDWRVRLANWTLDRLSSSRQDDILEVLEDDRDASLLTSPSDLLRWLRWAQLTPPRRVISPKEPRNLQHLLTASQIPWLAAHGAGFVRSLVEARFRDVDIPLGPATRDYWVNAVNPELLPRRRSAKKPRMEPALCDVSAAQSIDDLESAGVLVVQLDGRLDIAPIVRAELERTLVREAVRQHDVAAWGLWAVLDQRRDVVSAALLDCQPQHLADEVSKYATGSTLHEVGALEAAFEVLGLRMARGWSPPDSLHPTLRGIGLGQARLLREHCRNKLSSMIELPLTRRMGAPWEAHIAREQSWVTAAWTFSAHVKRPDDMEFELPAHLPGWTSGPSAADVLNAQLGTGTAELLEAARIVVRGAVDAGGTAHRHLAEVFVVAAVLEDLDLAPDDVVVRNIPLIAAHVLRSKTLDDGAKRRVVHRTLRALAAESGLTLLRHLANHGVADATSTRDPREWRGLVTEYADRALLGELLSNVHYESQEVSAAARLPEDLRLFVGRALVERPWQGWVEPQVAHALVEPIEDMDTLLGLAAQGGSLGYAAAEAAWELDEDIARHALLTAIASGPELRAIVLAGTANTSNRTRIAKEVSTMSSIPAGVLEHLVSVLPLLGSAAPAIYRAAIHRVV